MDWQHLFQDHILDRGLEYYHQGRVRDFRREDGQVEATVSGSEDYDVVIEIEDGEINDMDCDCPHAADGFNCKHMAAVLFYLEADSEDTGKVVGKGGTKSANASRGTIGTKSAREMVESAEESLVRRFLIELLEDDEKLFQRFRNAVGCQISPIDKKRYQQQIDEIFWKHAGRHHFIDYYHAGPFMDELGEFLSNDIRALVRNKKFDDAFELTIYIIAEMSGVAMDDSGGETMHLAYWIEDLWLDILNHCDIQMKQKMFRWLIDQLEKPDNDELGYLKERIEGVLFDFFKEDEFLTYKLEFTERKVAASKAFESSWARNHYAGRWVLRQIGVMEDQKQSDDLIDAACRENLEFSDVRKHYVGRLLGKGRTQEAIRVLEDGKAADRDLPGLVGEYSRKLKELYLQAGDRQAYEKELLSIVLADRNGNLADYRELKSLYSGQEWEEKRELIFDRKWRGDAAAKFYAEEKLYDRLLKAVLDSDGLSLVTEYERYLKPLYPAELLAKYETTVKAAAREASSRKRYQEIVALLKRMKKYPGGERKVEAIVAGFRTAYKNKPAMMEELKKL